MQRQRVWDLPIRLFHWLLVASIVFAYASGQLGGNLIEWHARTGYFIVGLVVFRLLWGLVGTPTARFASFVRGPTAIAAYLRGEWRGIGHNPLGALSVLALLGLVALQAATGLFTNDDIAFEGPLAAWVGKTLSDRFHSWHAWIQNGLLVLVAVHVAAILFYAHVKKENLVKPMITGWSHTPSHPAPPSETRRGGGVVAFLVTVALSAGVAYAAAGGLNPPPPPAQTPPAASPGW